MSLDGKPYQVGRVIKGNGVSTIEVNCGGTVFETGSGILKKCTNGHVHCVICRREARKFRKTWTCGVGCQKPGE